MIPNYETVKFDMLCCVDLPQLNGTNKQIYLNVEIQNNIHPGYSLVTRGSVCTKDINNTMGKGI